MLNSEILKYLISLLILFFAFTRISLLNNENIYIDLIIISAITDSPNSSIIFYWSLVVLEIFLAILTVFGKNRVMILVLFFYGATLTTTLIEFIFFDSNSYTLFSDNTFIYIFLRVTLVFNAFYVFKKENWEVL